MSKSSTLLYYRCCNPCESPVPLQIKILCSITLPKFNMSFKKYTRSLSTNTKSIIYYYACSKDGYFMNTTYYELFHSVFIVQFSYSPGLTVCTCITDGSF